MPFMRLALALPIRPRSQHKSVVAILFQNALSAVTVRDSMCSFPSRSAGFQLRLRD